MYTTLLKRQNTLCRWWGLAVWISKQHLGWWWAEEMRPKHSTRGASMWGSEVVRDATGHCCFQWSCANHQISALRCLCSAEILESLSSWWSLKDQPRSRCRKACEHLLPLVLLIAVWSLVDKSESHQHRRVSARAVAHMGWRTGEAPWSQGRLGQSKWGLGSFAACSTPACFFSTTWFTALYTKENTTQETSQKWMALGEIKEESRSQ